MARLSIMTRSQNSKMAQWKAYGITWIINAPLDLYSYHISHSHNASRVLPFVSLMYADDKLARGCSVSQDDVTWSDASVVKHCAGDVESLRRYVNQRVTKVSILCLIE